MFSSAHIPAGQPFHCPLNRRGETKGSGQLWASKLAYHMMVRSSSLSNGPAHAELHVKKRLQNAATRDASHSDSTPASLPRGTTSFFCVPTNVVAKQAKDRPLSGFNLRVHLQKNRGFVSGPSFTESESLLEQTP